MLLVLSAHARIVLQGLQNGGMEFIVCDVQPAVMHFMAQPQQNLPMLMSCLLDTVEHDQEVAKVGGGPV